jgi:predicted dehydrogenase
MNIAIVGCGGWADYTHIPCIMECSGINIISCADINIKNAETLHKKFGIPSYFADYREMLGKTNPDAVICLVSEDAIARVASDILLRNYPVMLEKPPGRTVEEANMIIRAAEKSSVSHMVAFNRRFAPVYLKLKEMIRDGAETVKYINYKFHRIKRHESYFETTAVHAVDAVKFLAGCDFSRVEIKYQEMPYLGKNVANYYLFFEFENGVYATAEILVSTGEIREGCEIHTEDGIYRASIPMGTGTGSGTDSGGIEYIKSSGKYHTVKKDMICPRREHYFSQGFYNEHKHFYECLKTGTCPGNGADSALQSVTVCSAIKNRERLLLF